MDIDELLCTLCLNQFDREDHLPLMLPKCGHTFCSKCLQDILSNLPPEEDFTCPEDQTSMKLSSRDISDFPQNLALLRLLEKKITLSIIEKQSDSLSREGRSLIIKGNKSSSDKSPDSTKDFPSPIMSPGGQNKSGSSVLSGFNQPDMFYFMGNESNMCREHMRKLEVVCLEHRCRICANCALFGSHKNHDIKPEEEVLRDIAARAEKLIDVFQVMEKSQNSTVEQETAEKVSERIRKKGDEVVRLVRQKFNDYVNVIRSKERRLLNDVSENFRKMEESLRIVKQVPQDLNDKIIGWKARAHDSLLTVTEKSEKGEIAFEMLEDRDNPKSDLLSEGEKLIIDLERSNEVSSRLFESNLSKISVRFDDNFLSNLEALCVVEIPEVGSTTSITKQQSQSFPQTMNSLNSLSSLNNIRDENKQELPLGDIMNRSRSPKKPSNNTQSRTNNFLEPERYDRQKSQSKSPAKGKAPKYMLPKSNLQKEDPYLKFESLNDKLGTSIENRFEDDHNLLNFEWKDLHVSNIPDSLPTFNREPLRHHSHHQRQLSEDLEHRENHRNESRYETANTSGRLNSSKDDIQSKTEKLNLSGKKSTGTRPTSPWKKGVSEGGVPNKPPRSKKRSVIKVADKFESVIEGIEQNNLDTADLTGADLGDQGVLALIEHLKENTALKSLKLLKNKLTDEGGVALAGLLNYNKTLHTINLTQNQLTEKTLDAFIEAIKAQKSTRLKSLYFSQNAMSQRNVKGKLKELAELGVNAIL